MKPGIRAKLLVFFFISLTGLACSVPSFGETREKGSKLPTIKQMVIESNNLEVDDQKKLVIFTGSVKAEGSEFKMTCQKLDLYYFPQKQVDPDKPKINIKKIVATGQVRILRAEGGSASAETAVYFQDEEKVVLTGNPKLKQEDDFVEGTKITLFLKERKSIVEGSEGNQVKAVVRIPENE